MKRKINHCFASALYQGRIKSDMKQQAVADFLGRTKRWYQKIESGESEPDLNDTLRLMAMFQYLPIQSEVTSPELGTYRAFGLRVFQVQNGVDEEVMILPDISTSFLFTLRLAALFTRKQLDPAHLLDVIADFL